jgi:hypothetical protein
MSSGQRTQWGMKKFLFGEQSPFEHHDFFLYVPLCFAGIDSRETQRHTERLPNLLSELAVLSNL